MADTHVTRDHAADARAAFLGLILGAVAVLVLMFAIVKLTNAKYAGAKHGAEAGQTH